MGGVSDEAKAQVPNWSYTSSHLRLLWPQWQGAGSDTVRSLAAEFPFDVARRATPWAREC